MLIKKIISIFLAGALVLTMGGCAKKKSENNSQVESSVEVNTEINADDFTASVDENGETVVVDNNGKVVETASVAENGNIVITDKKTGETKVLVDAKNVRTYSVSNTSGSSSVTSRSSSTSSGNSSKSKPSTGTGNVGKSSSKPYSGSVSTPAKTSSTQNGNRTSSNQGGSGSKYTGAVPSAAQIAKIEAEFFNLVNAERKRVGVAPLTRTNDLNKLTKVRANELLKKFSHDRPNGKSFSSIFDEYKYGEAYEDIWSDDGVNWHKDIRYSAGANTENIGFYGGTNYTQEKINGLAQLYFSGFRYSAGHYQNMINKNVKKTGIAVSYGFSMEDGQEVIKIYIAQLFTEK